MLNERKVRNGKIGYDSRNTSIFEDLNFISNYIGITWQSIKTDSLQAKVITVQQMKSYPIQYTKS